MRKALLAVGVIFLAVALSGCTVRTYPLTRDRIDQDLAAGNRGYVLGTAPTQAEMERATTRTTQVYEIEFGRPVKIESKKGAPCPATEPAAAPSYFEEPAPVEAPATCGAYEDYKVQKGDTLQKISQKFYGTSKKWNKIYQANTDVLKGPDKVYPGQTIKIPTQGMKTQDAPAGEAVPANLK